MGVAELDTPEARSTDARGVEDRRPSPGAQPRPPTALAVSPSSPRMLGPCDLSLGSHSPASLRDFLTPVGKSTVWGASSLGLGLHLLQVPHRPRSLWKALWCDIHTLRTAADLRRCHFQGVSGPSVHCSWRRLVWGPSAVKQGSTLRRYCGLTVSAPASWWSAQAS